MSAQALHDLADRAGLSRVWHDVFGTAHDVSPDSLRSLLAAFGLDAGSEQCCADSIALLDVEAARLPALLTGTIGTDLTLRHGAGSARIVLEDGTQYDTMLHDVGNGYARLPAIAAAGYHRLQASNGVVGLAIAPHRSFTVQDALARHGRSGKAWGLAAQVYSLPRDHDAGIGDFAALAQFAANAGRRGADAVAISPIHALYASEPRHYGPYGPSSRIALNPIYAALESAHAPRGSDGLIDWHASAPLRYQALRAAFAQQREDAAFLRFKANASPAIQLHARFEALVAHQLSVGAGRDWRQWPAALRDPASADVARLAAANQDECDFHLYAQFRVLADLQNAQRAATESGMAIGLIADLAVGADPAGSDAWSRPTEVLRGASVGAPPDEFNRQGQNWGLTAFSPRGLQQSGFSALRDMLEAALQPTGGVRIDHAMGLSRLWVIPEGGEAKDGCYLSYPFDDMRRLVMLESQRHQGIVVAEDLGTVPGGFRESLASSGITGMGILWFERDGDRFVPPAHWRHETCALTTTHDLPTAAGWWHGTDIAWRERIGIAGEDMGKRAHDRHCLFDACVASGAAQGDMPGPDDDDAIADIVMRHIATASSDLVIVPVEDALALREQPNIPGTIDEHPNWRRRLPAPAATLLDAPLVADRLAVLDRKRKDQA